MEIIKPKSDLNSVKILTLTVWPNSNPNNLVNFLQQCDLFSRMVKT